MPDFKKTQNTFSAGVVSSDFYTENISGSLSKLENIYVSSTGTLMRRSGSVAVEQVQDPNTVIIPFGDYLLVMSLNTLLIYKNNLRVQSFLLDWTIDSVNSVQWVQRFDTMIFVHPNNMPKILQKTGDTSFSFSTFKFAVDSSSYPILPFMRYPDTDDVSITLSTNVNGTNWATATASAAIWNTSTAGGFLYFMSKKWKIMTYISPTQIVLTTANSFTMPTTAFTDWKESAFSPRRGWPRSITFFQDRLVFGGSRDWPCGLWLSKTGLHNNFDTGTGLDDESIFITLLSETQQKICTCISSRDLQVLTDSGEWSISASPLTPSNVDVRQQTSIGTLSNRFVSPQKINGNTIFVSKNPGEIRELALDELSENYNATDLTLLVRHIISTPMSMAYNSKLCQLFVVMQDGTMTVLTKQPSLNISAWCVYKTNGLYKSVAVLGNDIYIIVQRGSNIYLEMFSDSAVNDCGTFNFSFYAESIPLMVEKHIPKKVRVTHASIRIQDTSHLKVMDQDFYFPETTSGDIQMNVLGSQQNTVPLWKIESDQQFQAKILSIGIDGQYEL